MGAFLYILIDGVLGLLEVAILVWAIMSWLVVFNVMNYRHPIVQQLDRFLNAVTKPVLWPIRRVVPTLGSVDISPLIALLIIEAARRALLPWIFGPIIGLLHG
jgi:YggT family protein